MNWRITWHAVVFRPEAMALINPVARDAQGYPQSYMHGDITEVRATVDEMATKLTKLGCRVTLVEIETVYQPGMENDPV